MNPEKINLHWEFWLPRLIPQLYFMVWNSIFRSNLHRIDLFGFGYVFCVTNDHFLKLDARNLLLPSILEWLETFFLWIKPDIFYSIKRMIHEINYINARIYFVEKNNAKKLLWRGIIIKKGFGQNLIGILKKQIIFFRKKLKWLVSPVNPLKRV